MKRIFAAIKIQPSELFQETYYNVKMNLKDEKIKWTALHNMHITLKFFGETGENSIDNVRSMLREIVFGHDPFTLKIINVGIFGSSYKPKVIWFGIEKNNQLINLGSDILNKSNNIGFVNDRQNFVPHLTIGRIKFLKDKNRFQEVIKRFNSFEIQEGYIEKFYLIESVLKPKDPDYIVLEEFNLA